jgi:DNA-binding transcriptional MerR regulator
MKTISIGAVCSLLKVKPHIIRYWEKEFPFLKPKRSLVGRREYSERELHLLFRLKYLLQKKQLTLETAKKQIWEEIDVGQLDMKLSIQQLRGEILNILEQLLSKREVK